MPEIKILVDGKVVEYSGLFRVDEFYGILRRFLKERGYFLFETQNQEDVLEGGKQVVQRLEPVKTLSDYAKSKLAIIIHIKNLNDRVITADGRKQKYQHGSVNLKFSAFLVTDHRNRWEGTGNMFLLRTLMNKFVKRDMVHTAEESTIKDCNDLQEELRSYLNMTRFKVEHAAPDKKADF
jgi:hypothetical protein